MVTRCDYCAVTTLAEVGLCTQCGAPLPERARGGYMIRGDQLEALTDALRKVRPGQVLVGGEQQYVVAHQYVHKV